VTTVQRTIEIERAQDEVFGYLADFSHAPDWDPATVSCERLDAGPIRVGARFRYVGTFRGRETDLDYTLEQLEPERRLVFVGRNRTVTATDELTFAGTGEHTTIGYTARLDFHGLTRLAAPLLKRTFERMGDEVAVRMRQVLEPR
jgi:carbon monoxide dehydrogenase subunit G